MKTVIVSISAKNIHKMLAPWCLKAYCEDKGLKDIDIVEASINDNINEIVGKIYLSKPDIVAFSCYIWNIGYVAKIGGLLKKLLVKSLIVLGGPEVSYEEDLSNYAFADYIIRGAGEKAFYDLLTNIGYKKAAQTKIIDGCSHDFNNYPTPYTKAYFDSFKTNQIPHIESQLVYYESSRGCPFSCSYCLSSTFKGVQYLSLEKVKHDLLQFVDKGAKCIKFTDRTFNSDKKRAKRILEFIYSIDTDCTFHFEAAADLFDEELMQIIEKMPIERVQFEIGIQTINENTLKAIDRTTNIDTVLSNIKRLVSFKNCHIHVDLIAGLPHETFASFCGAIDQCILCKPHMLQLGFLKMLKGTTLRGKNAFGAVFADFSPYEVYQTDSLEYSEIIKLKKVESVIERFYNSGAFESSINYAINLFETPFKFFEAFLDFCGTGKQNFKVSLKNAYSVLLDFLVKYGDKKAAEHYIKFDSLSFDGKGLLPDKIVPMRNRELELSYREKFKKIINFRIEFFEFDNTHKLFVYEQKNLISNKFEVKDITVETLNK